MAMGDTKNAKVEVASLVDEKLGSPVSQPALQSSRRKLGSFNEPGILFFFDFIHPSLGTSSGHVLTRKTKVSAVTTVIFAGIVRVYAATGRFDACHLLHFCKHVYAR